MQDCGSILLAHGMPAEAQEFFEKAGDSRAVEICEMQKEGKTSLSELYSADIAVPDYNAWHTRKAEEIATSSTRSDYNNSSCGTFNPRNRSVLSTAGVKDADEIEGSLSYQS